MELRTLKTYARRMERDLLSYEGISKISLTGFPTEEIEISFRENELRKYGLTFDEVINAVKNSNVKMTGGKIKGNREELLIRADVKGYYAKELENHVLRSSPDGTIVRLKDVANIYDRWSENPNRVYYKGRPAVRVTLQNLNEEDLFEMTRTVKAYLEEFNEENTIVQADVVRDGSEIISEWEPPFPLTCSTVFRIKSTSGTPSSSSCG